jgi:hypothetical protein
VVGVSCAQPSTQAVTASSSPAATRIDDGIL